MFLSSYHVMGFTYITELSDALFPGRIPFEDNIFCNWYICDSKFGLSFSLAQMLKCSLDLGNFCINHLQSKHPNGMVTSCSCRPQGHGRRWGLSCWQPPTPPVIQWLPRTLRYYPEVIFGVWYRYIYRSKGLAVKWQRMMTVKFSQKVWLDIYTVQKGLLSNGNVWWLWNFLKKFG